MKSNSSAKMTEEKLSPTSANGYSHLHKESVISTAGMNSQRLIVGFIVIVHWNVKEARGYSIANCYLNCTLIE